ncbi:DUF4309 domain-containing protein [Shimazuella kribbensis]|uniref:DUF4309 domain-containing protein n=1 Tax=Shimazuella kribbensis TaxID=139808 RepID=UPI0004263B7D|nr:DUF4309 domain-containing protein [Shimazuella kribbensis]
MITQKKSIKGMLVVALAVGTLLTGWVSTGEAQANSNPKSSVQQSTKQNHAQLLQQTKKLAAQGKVKTSGEFKIGSSQKEIEKKWGKADKDSKDGEMKYSKRHTRFEIDDFDGHKQSAFLLQTFDKSYSSVTYEELKKELGTGGEYKEKNSGYVSYNADGNTLTFYFTVNKGKFEKITHVEVTVP